MIGFLLWATVLAPALAALAVRAAGMPGGRGGELLRRGVCPAAVAGAIVALAPAAALLARAAAGETGASTLTWLPAAGGLEAGLRLDALSAVMATLVGSIGLVVVVHATGYFAGEPGRRPAGLAGLLGFLAAMQGLVLADGFLTLLVFWELVGAASSRLIAFTRSDPAAPPGAVRAFLTTRAADVGFYLAVLALFAGSGTLAFDAARPDGALGAVVGAGLVVAAVGKSAQAPLHNWLAGAMAGPTPVSALLHSATMVAAGVYLLVRAEPLLAGWPLELAGWIGALTAVAGAAIALAQRDLKRVLAGSTASQLGLMFVGLAAGGPVVAIFHLVAHAAGKAGLFLATGAFQRARDSVELERLRGAGRDDRPLLACFVTCALSIAAIPPLAGFWSKDHIAAAAESDPAWFALVLLAAAGAAAYMLRPCLVLLARDGAGRPRAGAGRPAMLGAAGAFAVASLGLGFAGAPLDRLLGGTPLPTSGLALVLSLVFVAIGAAAALSRWRPPRALARASVRQLYAGEAQRALVQRPALALAAVLAAADARGVDATVDATGRGTLRLAGAAGRTDRRWIDGAVDGLARAVGAGGERARRLQSGRLWGYLLQTVAGAAAVVFVIAIAALT